MEAPCQYRETFQIPIDLLTSLREGYMFPGSKDPRMDLYDKTLLLLQAASYLAQVIISSFGGKLGFDTNAEQAFVENIGGQDIKALPLEKVDSLIRHKEKETGSLERYYDRIAWFLERKKSNEIVVNKEELWRIAEHYAYKFRSLDEPAIGNKGDIVPKLHPLTWCPNCNDVPLLIIAPLIMSKEEVRRSMREIVYDLLFKAAEGCCKKCNGQLLPLGYTINMLAWTAPSSSDNSMVATPPSERPDRQEVYITLLNTTVGRNLLVSSIVRREEGKIISIESPQTELNVTGALVVSLPDTPLCF